MYHDAQHLVRARSAFCTDSIESDDDGIGPSSEAFVTAADAVIRPHIGGAPVGGALARRRARVHLVTNGYHIPPMRTAVGTFVVA